MAVPRPVTVACAVCEVHAEAVFLGIDGDGAQAQFGGSSKNANRDLAAIGDQ